MKRRARVPSHLPESLHKRLNAYALAASAAGVGMLALTPPSGYLLATGTVLAGLFALPDSAEAKIVYTPANEHLVCQSNEDGCSGNIYLSLNHGTSPDLNLKLVAPHRRVFG